MIRESIALPEQLYVSMRSKARFFYLVDTIADAHEPTSTQLKALECSYRSTGEFLSACSELDGLLLEVHAHGSRQLGTIVRPKDGSRQGFDIDLIARLRSDALRKYNGTHGPVLLLDHLHTAVERYAEAHQLRLHRWERCITLEYAEGMCADITPVIDNPLLSAPFGETHGLIPDRELKRYSSTNPRGYAKHFDLAAAISANFAAKRHFAEALDSIARANVTPLPDPKDVFDRLLCRLVQLMKIHRNVAFGIAQTGEDMAPSSVFITTLTAMAYMVEAPKPHESPLELLLDIVERMPTYFERIPVTDISEEWILLNPSAPHDNLAENMNSHARQKAFNSWHRLLVSDLKRILNAIENNSGMDTLLHTLEVAFGPRASNAIQQDQSRLREASRTAGRVTLIGAGVATPFSTHVRSHTYFGR